MSWIRRWVIARYKLYLRRARYWRSIKYEINDNAAVNPPATRLHSTKVRRRENVVCEFDAKWSSRQFQTIFELFIAFCLAFNSIIINMELSFFSSRLSTRRAHPLQQSHSASGNESVSADTQIMTYGHYPCCLCALCTSIVLNECSMLEVLRILIHCNWCVSLF